MHLNVGMLYGLYVGTSLVLVHDRSFWSSAGDILRLILPYEHGLNTCSMEPCKPLGPNF